MNEPWLILRNSENVGTMVDMLGKLYSKQATFGVAIVTYCSDAVIERCVRSITFPAEIVVIDNGGSPYVAEVLERVPQVPGRTVRYLANPVNVGFAQAANQAVGLLSGGAEWLLLLNPDVELAKDIDEIVAEMAEMAGAAHAVVVAGRLTASNGTAPNAKPLPGLLFELCRAVAGTSATLGLFSFFSHTRCSSPCDFRVVPQLDGAFMLMRKETFERLQGFDERFELYFEDADFCRRVRHTGGCLLATRVVGMHHAGHAARQARDDALAAFGVSRIRYLRKWWPLLGAPTAAACAILEFISRSLSARPEGRHARRRALRAQLMELLAPGSQTVLAKQSLSTR